MQHGLVWLPLWRTQAANFVSFHVGLRDMVASTWISKDETCLAELLAQDPNLGEPQGLGRKLLQGHPTEPWGNNAIIVGPGRQSIEPKRIIHKP